MLEDPVGGMDRLHLTPTRGDEEQRCYQMNRNGRSRSKILRGVLIRNEVLREKMKAVLVCVYSRERLKKALYNMHDFLARCAKATLINMIHYGIR